MIRQYTRAQWEGIAREWFGDEPGHWAFQCPRCNFVQSAALFIKHDVDPARHAPYRQCLGRHVPFIGGCDYSRLHSPILLPHTIEVWDAARRVWMPVFNFAPYSPAVEMPQPKKPEPARLYRRNPHWRP